MNNSTTLYIDGFQQASVTHIGIESFDDNDRVYFGAGSNPTFRVPPDPAHFYTGLMDDVQLYDVVLTPSQVAFLANNPGSVIPGSIVPTLSPWGLVVLASGLAGLAALAVGRGRKAP